MRLLNTLRFILGHPLNRGRRLDSIMRFASWQLGLRLLPGPVAVKFVDETLLLVSRGQAGATGNVYGGLHELPGMAFTLHLLRPGDLFVDVGANVGSYTVLAAGAAGAECISFEPAREAFRALLTNIRINDLSSRVDARPTAVGASDGVVSFTSAKDTLNHVVGAESNESSTNVPMTTLDRALDGKAPLLIKIDVEGSEDSVIQGAARAIRHTSLLAIIVESNENNPGHSQGPGELRTNLESSGFKSYAYDPFTRRLEVSDRPAADGNTIYVRDVSTVAERLTTARKFAIPGRGSL